MMTSTSTQVHYHKITEKLINKFDKVFMRDGITKYHLLFTAYNALLHRFFGQENILVVLPLMESGELFAMHTSFSGDPTVRELLLQTAKSLQGAAANHAQPDKLFRNNGTMGNANFQVFFSLNNIFPINYLVNHGFNFALQLRDNDRGIEVMIAFDTDYYDDQDVSQFCKCLDVLLESIISNPEQRISELPLLTTAERHKILFEWNNTQAEYDQDALLHTLIEDQASRSPDTRAIIFDGQGISFAELNQRANQLAHYLLSFDLKPETLIGICMDCSIDMVVSLLAILKAGGAYVPLDPNYPKDRNTFIAQDSQMPYVLTQSHMVERLPTHTAHAILVDKAQNDQIARLPTSNPNAYGKSNNLACVIYTSGSTGRPKGVMLTHQNIVSRLQTTEHITPPLPNDIYAQISSLCFVDHIEEIFFPLIYGFPTNLIPSEIVKSPRNLVATLEQNKATRIVIVPSQLRSLLNHIPDIGKRLSKLKYWQIGGEALPQDLNNSFYKKFPSAILVNFYGTTETTADATSFDTNLPTNTPYIPIGRPLENVQIYILDRKLQPLPIGVPGEIFVAGTSIARGYLNRPDLTSERFIKHPFSQQPEARLFRTGDLGRYGADGSIEFMGRTDHQVKIRGMRVELGEIEMTLDQHPGVKESVVISREISPEGNGTGKSTRLIGYVVPNRKKSASGSQLREYLKKKLPDYTVPAAIIVIDAFTLTPNGKVDKQALPDPQQGFFIDRNEFIPPRDQIELKLTMIFESLLSLSPIGIHDNFFDLGGDSLMAVDLLAEIERNFDNNIPISIFFQTNTVAGFAKILREQSKTHPWSSLVPIQPNGKKAPFFCVHADGSVLIYKNLSQLLGPDQPFYGLQAQGLDGKHPPFDRIEKMAAHYIKEIQCVQPTGPYYLGAFSLGGIVLFEMAQQLYDAGESVGLVGFFDAHGPGYPQLSPGVSKLSYKLSVHQKCLQLLDLRGKLDYLSRRAKNRFQTLHSIILGWLYTRLNIVIPHSVRYNVVRENLYKAADEYNPRPYPGKIHIFRATNQPEGVLSNATLGWDQYCSGEIEVVDVLGSHNSIIKEPHIQGLAHELETCLTKARENVIARN